MSPIEKAIELAGGTSALAKKIGVNSPQVVSNWVARKRVPPKYCAAVERATDGKITRQHLRPELWGDVVLPPQPVAKATS
ncbi:MAG: helix-turn-helix domain-containing protein [Burkholderiales bacterium]|nr:helix-turn-helix domain-containing protein [Burkholderiales bacterium]